MLPFALPAGLQVLLPFLKAAGLDPEKLLQKAGRDQVTRKMEKLVPGIVADLEGRNLTATAGAADPVVGRQLIRSAMFQSAKAFIPFRKGAGHLADALRDAHDDLIVNAIVISPTDTTEALVRRINALFLDRVF